MIQKKNILIHLLICIGFLLIPFVFFAGEFLSTHGKIRHYPYDAYTVIAYFFLLAVFYFNYYFLIPNYYLKRRYAVYTSLLFALFIFLIGSHYIIKTLPHQKHIEEHRKHERHMHQNRMLKEGRPPLDRLHSDMHGERPPRFYKPPPPIFQLTQLVFLFILGILIGLYLRIKKNMDQIIIEKNNAERSYLKSQINPHFLFNTFNSIYSLAIKENADLTANGMLMLSGMMRYVVTESSEDFVPLEKEINYINDFIELQKLRLDKGIRLNYKVEGNTDDKQIAPLMLIPFIENAFKHGVNPDEDSAIDILISILDDELILKVVNNKVLMNHDMDEKLGFGIENTKNRLNLIYPNKHSLMIEETNSTYQVFLKISLI